METKVLAKHLTGSTGEDIAAQYLLDQDWIILSRNWRCGHGEVDIIAVDPGDTIVFVEVKTRRGLAYGNPLDAITYAKIRKLQQLVSSWVIQQPTRVGKVRLDGIAVLLQPGCSPQISHAIDIS